MKTWITTRLTGRLIIKVVTPAKALILVMPA